MTPDPTFDATYFDALYQRDQDPWGFRSSTYEKEKYAATLAALPRERYSHALELGCSIGEFTHLLAGRVGYVTAVDTSNVALDMARLRCADAHNVEFIQAQLPAGPWERPADLIVLSEILYYLGAPAIDRLASRLLRCASDADMLLVHWTGETNYPLSGDDATERFLQSMGSRDVRSVRSPQYRLDVVHGQAFPKDHR